MTPTKKKETDPSELMARREYGKAIAIYRDRLQQQPDDRATKLALADALAANKEIDEALKYFGELAEIYTQAGFLVRAIAVYKKMLRLRPDMKDVEKLLSELSEKRKPSAGKELDEASGEIETKLFADLTAAEFRQLVKSFTLQHYPENTVVVKEGDPGSSLFIIVHGEVRVITRDSNRREIVLANLGDAEFFGEVSLLTGKPRTATIITNTASEMLELTREDYQRIVARHPHVQNVVEAFHEQRAYKTIEAMLAALHKQP